MAASCIPSILIAYQNPFLGCGNGGYNITGANSCQLLPIMVKAIPAYFVDGLNRIPDLISIIYYQCNKVEL